MQYAINYAKWQKVITRLQKVILIVTFVMELLGCLIEHNYYTGLIIPMSISLCIFISVYFAIRKVKLSVQFQKYLLLLSTLALVTITGITHHEHHCIAVIYAVPICVTIFYEDKITLFIVSGITYLSLTATMFMHGYTHDYGNEFAIELIVMYSILLMLVTSIMFGIDTIIEKRTLSNSKVKEEQENRFIAILQERNDTIEQLYHDMAIAFSKAVDYNDTYTAGHSRRVAEYSKEIARRMGLSKEDCDEVYYAGLLHDVGKLGVDVRIINKNGRLSDEEFDIIKEHPIMGYELLKDIKGHPWYALAAKYHHERVDGTGYPCRLQEIPLVARIIAVADSYDAMTSRRAYRGIMEQSAVRRQIVRGIGTQFDKIVATVMLDMIDEDIYYDLKQKDRWIS